MHLQNYPFRSKDDTPKSNFTANAPKLKLTLNIGYPSKDSSNEMGTNKISNNFQDKSYF